MRTLLLTVALAAATAGCRTPQDEVRPDDMSAAAHRDAAAQASAEAAQHRARYDPSAREPFVDPGTPTPGLTVAPQHNPTRIELERASELRVHAEAHAQAAAALEKFEDEACKAVPSAERAACPLIGPVVAVQDIPTGIRITLARAKRSDEIIRRMRCHLAFARARAFDVTSCALYVRGLSIEPGPLPGSIELRGANAAAVEEIRRRAPEELSLPLPSSAAR